MNDLVNKSGDLVKDLVNDTISRAAAVKALEETKQSDPFNRYEYQNIGIDWSIDAVKALPSAQPDVPDTYVGDMISRQAAIETVRKAQSIGQAHRMLLQLPSAQPGWIPCSEKMPPDYQWYYATCKSLVDNRENWVVEGCYTPWEHFNSTPMIKCGKAEVIAWMPKGFPEPWEGEQDNGTD